MTTRSNVARLAVTMGLATATAAGSCLLPATAAPTAGSTTTTAAATTARALTAKDRIGYVGVGSYTLGRSASSLRAGKLIEVGSCEGTWRPVKQARDFAGASTFFTSKGRLTQVWVTKPSLKTYSGATVGMSMARVKKIYGKKFHYVTVTRVWGNKKVVVGQVRSGGREVLFVNGTSGFDATSAKDSSKVGAIVARDVSRYLPVVEC